MAAFELPRIVRSSSQRSFAITSCPLNIRADASRPPSPRGWVIPARTGAGFKWTYRKSLDLAPPWSVKREVNGILRGPSGREARVTTIWIVKTGEGFPRLVTIYPGDDR